MPELRLPESNAENWDVLYSRMLHPINEKEYQHYLNYKRETRNFSYTHKSNDEKPDNSVLQMIRRIKKEEKKAQRYLAYGWTSGMVLFWMLSLHMNNQPSSFNLACYITERQIDRSKRLGKQNDGSPSQIRKKWGEYKAVSHFWSAFIVAENTNKHSHAYINFKAETILNLSLPFLYFGTSFIPERSKHPTLIMDECWTSPSKFFSPEPEVEIQFPKIGPIESQWITEYHANKNWRN